MYGGNGEKVYVDFGSPAAGSVNPGILDLNSDPDLSGYGFTTTTSGVFMITYSITFESGYANRSSFGVQVRSGEPRGANSAMLGSNNVQYFRHNAYGHRSTVTSTFVVDMGAGEKAWLSTILLDGSGPFTSIVVDGTPGIVTVTRLA